MPPQEQKKSGKNIITIVVAFVVLLVIVFLVSSGRGKQPTTDPSTSSGQAKSVTKETVAVKSIDLKSAKTGVEKLPDGFPSDIPIELANIDSGEEVSYTDRGVVTYNVSFYSTKSGLEKFNEYEKYMLGAKYRFGVGNRDKAKLFLYGTRPESDMSVNITEKSGRTYVAISYLQK